MIVLRRSQHFPKNCGRIFPSRRPSPRAVSSPGRALASAATAGAAAPRLRSREAPVSEYLRRALRNLRAFSCPVGNLTQCRTTHKFHCCCVIPSRAYSPTSRPPGASANSPAPPSWGPVRAGGRELEIYDMFHPLPRYVQATQVSFR